MSSFFFNSSLIPCIVTSVSFNFSSLFFNSSSFLCLTPLLLLHSFVSSTELSCCSSSRLRSSSTCFSTVAFASAAARSCSLTASNCVDSCVSASALICSSSASSFTRCSLLFHCSFRYAITTPLFCVFHGFGLCGNLRTLWQNARLASDARWCERSGLISETTAVHAVGSSAPCR